jgi:hypothetical protein
MNAAIAAADPAAASASPAPPVRFLDNGDGTVTDLRQGLMWSKATIVTECTTHAKAEQACASLDLAGHTDWRLPTVEELFLLADRSRKEPAIDTDVFPDTQSDWYWTSTLSAWSSDCAWVVIFGSGYADFVRRDYNYALARAVRSVPAGQ